MGRKRLVPTYDEKPHRRRRLAAVVERSASERSASEQPASEQPASEQPASEQPASEQPVSEQSASEQPAKHPKASTKATPGKPKRPTRPPALRKKKPTKAETAAQKALEEQYEADKVQYKDALRQRKARKTAEKRRTSQPSPGHRKPRGPVPKTLNQEECSWDVGDAQWHTPGGRVHEVVDHAKREAEAVRQRERYVHLEIEARMAQAESDLDMSGSQKAYRDSWVARGSDRTRSPTGSWGQRVLKPRVRVLPRAASERYMAPP